MNEIRWQRRKGSGIKYFRGLSYQLGKQLNTEAVFRREISMSRNQKDWKKFILWKNTHYTSGSGVYQGEVSR